MNKKWIVVVVLASALIVPAVARAHEGHDQTVMGTISSIQGTNLMVKQANGKEIMVMLNAETKITQGKTTVDAKALKVGDRVVASGAPEKGMITAETLKLGTAPAAAGKTAKK